MNGLILALNRCGLRVERAEPAINWGGCGVYAARVGRALVEAGRPAWGRVISSDLGYSGDLDEIRPLLRPDWSDIYDWEAHGVHFSHIQVQFELDGVLYTHDTSGTYMGDGPYRYDMVGGRLTVEEMERLAASPRGWNRDFDRSRGIPLVERYVDSYLRSYARTRAQMELQL